MTKGVRNELIREPTPIIHEAHIRKVKPKIPILNIADSTTEECKAESRQRTISKLDEIILATRNEEIFMNPLVFNQKSPNFTPFKTVER